MLATAQILIHLIMFLMVVIHKQSCRSSPYRLGAGLLAFSLAGFNLSMVGYLIMIQPQHAVVADYLHLGLSLGLLAVIAHCGGSTARMIDNGIRAIKNLLA